MNLKNFRVCYHKQVNYLSLQKNLKISYKSKNQPVTNADIEIDQFLSSFSNKTPNFGWLSEESVDNKSRQESDFLVFRSN